jgi:hypothetical protein
VVTVWAPTVLDDVLGDDAEILPLTCDEEDLWLIHAWRLVDALDEDNSVFNRFASSGRIRRVTRYAFREDMVQSRTCFRVPQLRAVMFCDRWSGGGCAESRFDRN